MAVGKPKRDHSIGLFALSLFLAAFAYLFYGMSVHTYCEDRPTVVFVALAAAVTSCVVILRWPRAIWRRGIALLSVLLCVAVIVFNGWSFVWATHLCAEQEKSFTK